MLVMNSIASVLYSNMPKKKKTNFYKSWINQEQYKDWLAEAPEDNQCQMQIM